MSCEHCGDDDLNGEIETSMFCHIELRLCLDCRRELNLKLAKQPVVIESEILEKQVDLLVNSGDPVNLDLLAEKVRALVETDHKYSRYVLEWLHDRME